MLVSIIGCPSSGKTTTAAMVFAQLKEQGLLAELIPEQARIYIAEKRVSEGLRYDEFPKLNDVDQGNIMLKQLLLEETMLKACHPDTIIVCDSSTLNSLLYMSEPYLKRDHIKEYSFRALKQYDAVYYSTPTGMYGSGDANRIHDEAFSLKLDERIPKFFSEYTPSLQIAQVLRGDPQARARLMFNDILNRAMSKQ